MKHQWLAVIILLFFPFVLIQGQFFSGSDDKFIKKYAMMKVYESCFGQDVIKQVCREMNEARLRCASSSSSSSSRRPTTPIQQPQHPAVATQQQHYIPKIPITTHLLNQQQQQQPTRPVVAFDPAKLEQAILAVRVGQVAQNPYKTLLGTSASGGYRAPPVFSPSNDFYSSPAYNPLLHAFSPYSSHHHPFDSPQHQPEVINLQGMYPIPPQAGSAFRLWPSPASIGHRASRDLDLRSTIEALTTRMSGRVRNVTCVMQELGYLDENLEPNYAKMVERIDQLDVQPELKKDMLNGIEYCKQFAQCLPESPSNRFGLNREITRPMFFFKCYKQKKLEACVMKDVREKLSSADLGMLTAAGEVGSPEVRTDDQVNDLHIDPSRIIADFFEQDNESSDWDQL